MNTTGRHGGHTIRLQRIWKHEKAVIIPYDHGAYSGVVEGLEDPRRLTERIAATAADAVLVAPGVLRAIAPALGSLGVVLRMDGGFTSFAAVPSDYQTLAAAEDAVRLGADAGIIFTFIGVPDEAASLQRLGRTAADADIWGLPLIAEVLPPGLLNNHFGSGIWPKGRKNADIVVDTRNVARVAVETGADIIKTRYTGDVASFRSVVETCGAPVIVAGGPKLDGTDEALLRLAHDCMHAGAAGIIFGRNVWHHPKMERLIAALCAIVHEDEGVDAARKLLR
ncbi:MAG TPA: fructose-bisphosphate aldolase [Bacteroidota bacterium]|nr:fructose-bisphosphate aldolase [Bacteroidota bacterium]